MEFWPWYNFFANFLTLCPYLGIIIWIVIEDVGTSGGSNSFKDIMLEMGGMRVRGLVMTKINDVSMTNKNKITLGRFL